MNADGFQEPAPDQVSDLALELYKLGELSGVEARRVGYLLAHDDRLRRRLAALDRADDGIDHLARDVISRVRDRERAERPVPARMAMAAALAILAVILIVVAVRPAQWRTGAGDAAPATASDEKQKGPPAWLVIYRNTPHGSESLNDNDLVRAGDLIRVGYRAAQPGYGAIISVDGRGGVSAHMPAAGTDAQVLSPGERVLLDSAFELDDAPTVECFYLITSSDPFSLQPLMDEARRAAASEMPPHLTLAPSFTITTLALRKDARP